MDPALEGHRRYLHAWRASCLPHAGVHRYQLAALDREIALAVAARDLEDYYCAGADPAAVGRGAQYDRVAHAARVDAVLYDPLGAPVRLTRLLVGLTWLHSGGVPAEIEPECRASLGQLHGLDPAFRWPQCLEQPRYRWRVPWSGPAIEAITAWIDALGPVPPQPPAPSAAYPQPPSLAEWRASLGDHAPGVVPEQPTTESVLAPFAEVPMTAAREIVAAGSGALTPQEALARICERGLLARLAAEAVSITAHQALQRQQQWPDDLMKSHWLRLLGDLQVARTTTEVELIAHFSTACLVVLGGWNQALLAGLLAPLREAARIGWSGRSVSALHQAAACTRTLTGVAARDLFEVPRVAEFIDRTIVPLTREGAGVEGAFLGEAGFEAFQEAVVWARAGRARGRLLFRDAQTARESFLWIFDHAALDRTGTVPLPIVLPALPSVADMLCYS